MTATRESISLENLAKQVTLGRPYVIIYKTIANSMEILGNMYVCDDLDDIKKLISDELNPIEMRLNGSYHIKIALEESQTIWIDSMGRMNDQIIIRAYGLTGENIHELNKYVKILISKFPSTIERENRIDW